MKAVHHDERDVTSLIMVYTEVLNLAMLNYTTIIEIFALTIIAAAWVCRNIVYYLIQQSVIYLALILLKTS
jgi:hypothetical protein